MHVRGTALPLIRFKASHEAYICIHPLQQAKWDEYTRQHEKALEQQWLKHQEKVRNVTKRYNDEILKNRKLQEEVKALTGKVVDLRKLNELVCVSQEDDM